jgi:hypothetical protein
VAIWQDKVTRRDRTCRVTDADLRQHQILRRRDAARFLVDRLMLKMPVEQARAITPQQKWAMVDKISHLKL